MEIAPQDNHVATVLSTAEEHASHETLLLIGRLLQSAGLFSTVDDRIVTLQRPRNFFNGTSLLRPADNERLPFESVAKLLDAGLLKPNSHELTTLISVVIQWIGGHDGVVFDEEPQSEFGIFRARSYSLREKILQTAQVRKVLSIDSC